MLFFFNEGIAQKSRTLNCLGRAPVAKVCTYVHTCSKFLCMAVFVCLFVCSIWDLMITDLYLVC